MTEPSTARSVRKIRHSIRKRAFVIFQLTKGVPGATKEQQIQVFDQQIHLLTEALEKAKEARDLVFMRDFEAHQEAKASAQAQQLEINSIPDSPEKAADDLTFEQIIAQLNGEVTETTEAPEDQTPPF